MLDDPFARTRSNASVTRFLDRFAAEAGKSLPPIDVEILREEMRAHLEESIQARLELGASEEEAERQALAEFGSAKQIGTESRRQESTVDRGFLAISLAVLVFWIDAISIGPPSDALNDVLLLLLLALHVLFLRAAARTRRFQAETLAYVLGGAWMLWSLKGALWFSMVPGEAYDIPALDFLREAIATVRLGGWVVPVVYVSLYAVGWASGRIWRLVVARVRTMSGANRA